MLKRLVKFYLVMFVADIEVGMLTHTKIGTKLKIGFALVVAIILAMVSGVSLAVVDLSTAYQRDQASNLAEAALAKVTEQMFRADRAFLAFAVKEDPRYIEAASNTLGGILTDFDQTTKMIPPDRRDLIDEVAASRVLLEAWLRDFARPRFDHMNSPDSKTFLETSFLEGRDRTTRVAQSVQAAQKHVGDWSSHEDQLEQAALHRLVLSLAIGTVIAVGCAILSGVLIGRSITNPIHAMLSAMSRLASGATDVIVPATDRRDEVGDIGRAVQVFKDAAIEKLRLERQADTDRASAQAERDRDEQRRQVLANQQAVVVQDLAEGLGRLAKGDLTCTLENSFAPEYERLRHDFNAAVDELRNAIITIVANTAAIRSGTGEISQASDDLSRRTEQQAASLEQTAAALDQITATVRRTAEAAASTRTVVGIATTEAEKGEAVVRSAVTAMTEIETSARNISQIIGTIDEIAFQTNLLALNAGVEAARAGETGRGFAVVASEVRALAQRSADAAKEIKSLIGNSSRQVDQGVKLVNDAGTTLSRIMGQVTEINTAVTAIAASAQEQATGLAEVNIAVNQMDQVTQQNAAMVEQSTAASHSLAQDTAELERLTARFNTGAGSQPAATHDAAVSRRAERSPAASQVRSSAPVKSLRLVSSSSTARNAGIGKESWAEF